jgi:hypothetical protein
MLRGLQEEKSTSWGARPCVAAYMGQFLFLELCPTCRSSGFSVSKQGEMAGVLALAAQ